MSVNHIVGVAVRAIRVSRGMTQAELGVELAAKGATSQWQSGVAALEAGRKSVGFEDLMALSEVFDVAPQTFLAIRRESDSRRGVAVGEQRLTRDEWNKAWRISKEDENSLRSAWAPTKSPRERRREATLKTFRRVRIENREQALSARRKFPGPTFLADRKFVTQLRLDELDSRVPLQLNPGEPYVARDAIEAGALTQAAEEGRIRRIDRFEARRIRAKRHGDKGGKTSGQRT